MRTNDRLSLNSSSFMIMIEATNYIKNKIGKGGQTRWNGSLFSVMVEENQFSSTTSNSVRLFNERPSAVLLSAMGLSAP